MTDAVVHFHMRQNVVKQLPAQNFDQTETGEKDADAEQNRKQRNFNPADLKTEQNFPNALQQQIRRHAPQRKQRQNRQYAENRIDDHAEPKIEFFYQLPAHPQFFYPEVEQQNTLQQLEYRLSENDKHADDQHRKQKTVDNKFGKPRIAEYGNADNRRRQNGSEKNNSKRRPGFGIDEIFVVSPLFRQFANRVFFPEKALDHQYHTKSLDGAVDQRQIVNQLNRIVCLAGNMQQHTADTNHEKTEIKSRRQPFGLGIVHVDQPPHAVIRGKNHAHHRIGQKNVKHVIQRAGKGNAEKADSQNFGMNNPDQKTAEQHCRNNPVCARHEKGGHHFGKIRRRRSQILLIAEVADNQPPQHITDSKRRADCQNHGKDV